VIGKLIQGAVVSAVVLVFPAVGRPQMLVSAHVWILVVLGVAASVLQPSYNPFAVGKGALDRKTGAQIIWSVYLTQLLVMLEATYLRYPACIAWDTAAWVGLGGAVSGLVLRTWSVRTLGRFFTMHVAVGEGQHVVQTGPYRIVRHPSYLGALLTYVSTAVFLHAWYSLGVALVILPCAFARRIGVEEQALRAGLGEPYESYCRRVKRLLPFIW
jgi:protein-S-isoprenylcysteine O-methyltransferase